MTGTVVLCSDDLGALDGLPGARRAVLVPDAAAALADGAEIVDRERRRLARRGLEVRTVPAAELGALGDGDLVVVSGGDPFHLLGVLRATGAADRLRIAVAAGVPYAGLSAGAMVAGPDLAPASRTGPFAPRPGQDLRGLGFAAILVLPHNERPGREARHRDALAAWAHRVPVVPLGDEDAVVVAPGADPELRGPQRGVRLRAALPGDAAGIAAVFVAAARAAWSAFLGAERMRAVEPDATEWRRRIEDLGPGHAFVVATRDGAVTGFAHVDTVAGVLETCYTHPSEWGRGTGRALLGAVHGVLRAAGRSDATLWTEERNVRARRVYEAAGWRADGGVQERKWHGARLRELRYRVALG